MFLLFLGFLQLSQVVCSRNRSKCVVLGKDLLSSCYMFFKRLILLFRFHFSHLKILYAPYKPLFMSSEGVSRFTLSF